MWASSITGIGANGTSEKLYLYGYNGTGGAVSAGTPVCWDAVASNGRTFVLPTATGFSNLRLVAGVCEDAVASGDYTGKIVAYGPCNARTYGVASTFIPGCQLQLVADKTYLAYGTDGQVALQRQTFVALQTNATTDTVTTKVFVRAL